MPKVENKRMLAKRHFFDLTLKHCAHGRYIRLP